MKLPNTLQPVSAILLCSVFFLFGCIALEEKPAHIPYLTLYQEIDDPEALRFLEQGLTYLRQHHAPLASPISEVHLRHSRKNATGGHYAIAQGFSKTEILDHERGVCVIYIGVPPGDREFYPLLAHEIGHLKDPSQVEDWAMEGFCMVFSEALCAHLGADWSAWRQRFIKSSEDPYAKAYWEAREQL